MASGITAVLLNFEQYSIFKCYVEDLKNKYIQFQETSHLNLFS